jgi:hypothetical protein
VHAQDAEFAELDGKFTDGQFAALVPRRDLRGDATLHDGSHGVANLTLLVVEQTVDA